MLNVETKPASYWASKERLEQLMQPPHARYEGNPQAFTTRYEGGRRKLPTIHPREPFSAAKYFKIQRAIGMDPHLARRPFGSFQLMYYRVETTDKELSLVLRRWAEEFDPLHKKRDEYIKRRWDQRYEKQEQVDLGL